MIDKMERILIAGCGDIGTPLGFILAEEGHSVWGLRRRAEPLPGPLRTLRADLSDPRSLAALPERLDRIYYTATPGQFSDEAYRRTYVTGFHNLLSALKAARQDPRRVIFVSSTAVYGQCHDEWVDEDSIVEPTTFSGRRMQEAEQVGFRSDFPVIVVRFGGIYGPGRTRMLSRVAAGEPCVETPPHYTNRIQRDDCVGILAHVGELDKPAPIYLGVDDCPCPQCELMDWLAQRMRLPKPKRVTPNQSNGLRTGSKRCRNTRIKASGYRFIYPTFREGYEALLNELD